MERTSHLSRITEVVSARTRLKTWLRRACSLCPLHRASNHSNSQVCRPLYVSGVCVHFFSNLHSNSKSWVLLTDLRDGKIEIQQVQD